MPKKAKTTQDLVNIFPSWARIRKDEQSNGFILMNSIGHNFDDLLKQRDNNQDGYFISTANISDIDNFYSFQLPRNYEFTLEDNDPTQFNIVAPTVSGLVGTTWYSVEMPENNNIEEFWYKAIPDRISYSEVVSGEHILTTGEFVDSPYMMYHVAPSGVCHIANKLSVKIDGGKDFIGVYGPGIVRKGLVQLEGVTREGLEVTEELVFLHDETQQTIHDYSYLVESGVRVYGIEPTSGVITVSSALFNQDDYALNYPTMDKNDMREDDPRFVSLGVSPSGVSTLNFDRYVISDLETRIDGFSDRVNIWQQDLVNSSGEEILSALDIAVQPHSDYLWIVEEEKLHLFNTDYPYATTSNLNKKQGDARSVILPQFYVVPKGEEVEIEYHWALPNAGMVRHRAWVEKPDGNKYSLVSGTEVTYDTSSSSWIYGEPASRNIRPAETYTLDQYGDYIYSLEVEYTDGTSSIDQRIVTVSNKTALASFDVSHMGIVASGVDIDSEYNIWIADANNVKHKINLHYDDMVIDPTRKVIYFREEYDKVKVY